MSEAEELLDGLSDEEMSLYGANPDLEGYIVIDENRIITVPDNLKRIAVQNDHNIETVTFSCPRYWDGNDLSTMNIEIVYERPDGIGKRYRAQNVTVNEDNSDIMFFDWTISNNVTLVPGNITFLVCINKKDSDGINENCWHSEINKDLYVIEGMKCDDIENDDV